MTSAGWVTAEAIRPATRPQEKWRGAASCVLHHSATKKRGDLEFAVAQLESNSKDFYFIDVDLATTYSFKKLIFKGDKINENILGVKAKRRFF